MVIESADPGCASTTWAQSLFKKARAEIAIVIPSTPAAAYHKLAVPIPVTITGFIFFDKIHGQTGVAPNGVEIHPILSMVKKP